MKKHNLINLFLLSLITTQTVGFSNVTQAMAVNEEKPTLMAQKTTELTEEKINSIMEIIESAEKEEKITTILDFFSPYIITYITVESDDTTIITSLEGKTEHQEFLESNFSKAKDREYINSYRSIRITEDGQMASVTRIRATNVTTEKGEKYLSVGTDKIRFALIDNQPKIVNIEAKGWLEKRP